MILDQCIPFVPFINKPKPTVAPVMLCVVETGKCANVATISHVEHPEIDSLLWILAIFAISE